MTHAQIGVYLPILNERRKPPMPADLGLVSAEPAVLVAGLLEGAEGADGADGVLWAVVAAVVVAVVVAEGMGSAILALRAESNIGRIHWEGLREPLSGKACVQRAQIKLVTPRANETLQDACATILTESSAYIMPKPMQKPCVMPAGPSYEIHTIISTSLCCSTFRYVDNLHSSS